MSAIAIQDYANCLLSASQDHNQLLETLHYSITRLGAETFIDIIQRGLQSITKNDNTNNVLSTIKSIAHHKRNTVETLCVMDIFDASNTECTTSICSFLSIYDQIHFKLTSRHFNDIIPYIDVTQHDWIEISYDSDIFKLCSLFNSIRLNTKTFNKVCMVGTAQFDWNDNVVLNASLNKYLPPSYMLRSAEEAKARQKAFSLQMGCWLFIANNICSNNGIFITPKLEIKLALKIFVSQTATFFQEKKKLYPQIKPYSKNEMNTPHMILFQTDDGTSIDENGIDFCLEKIECLFDDIMSLFIHNRKIHRIFIVQKYGIYNKGFKELVLKRCAFHYGEAFGDRKNRFCRLKKSKNGYYTLYLRFNRRLLEQYTPRNDEEEQWGNI